MHAQGTAASLNRDDQRAFVAALHRNNVHSVEVMLNSVRAECDLYGQDIGGGSMASLLGIALKRTHNVRSLNVGSNPLGTAGCLALAAAFTTNTSVCEFELVGNRGPPFNGEYRVTPEDAHKIGAQVHAHQQVYSEKLAVRVVPWTSHNDVFVVFNQFMYSLDV